MFKRVGLIGPVENFAGVVLCAVDARAKNMFHDFERNVFVEPLAQTDDHRPTDISEKHVR